MVSDMFAWGSNDNLGLLGGTEEMEEAIQICLRDNLEFWHMHLPGEVGTLDEAMYCLQGKCLCCQQKEKPLGVLRCSGYH